jgi:hypothetical protein
VNPWLVVLTLTYQVVNNLRLVIENLLKYGLLINMNVINHYIDWIDLSWTLSKFALDRSVVIATVH